MTPVKDKAGSNTVKASLVRVRTVACNMLTFSCIENSLFFTAKNVIGSNVFERTNSETYRNQSGVWMVNLVSDF